jgi:hypothetical protein
MEKSWLQKSILFMFIGLSTLLLPEVSLAICGACKGCNGVDTCNKCEQANCGSSVPEPSIVIGTVLVGGGIFASKLMTRKK